MKLLKFALFKSLKYAMFVIINQQNYISTSSTPKDLNPVKVRVKIVITTMLLEF